MFVNRLVTFHMVTMFDPVLVARLTPVPTKSLSVVPSKNVSRGEQSLAGFVAAFIFMFPFMTGVVFITPFGANDMEYSAGFVLAVACAPHA